MSAGPRSSAVLAALPLALALPAAAAPLNAPFRTPAAATASRPGDCGPVPPPVTVLDTAQPYQSGDASYSRIDPRKRAGREAAAAPMRSFTASVARLANRYVASGGRDRRSGACALLWLESWAKADALRSTPTHDAQFLRSVALSGWALDYAQVRGLRVDTAHDPRPVITAWFARMAADLRRHYDGLSNVTARNNHRAWAGLAAAAVAMNSGDRELARWGYRSAQIVLNGATPQGALPPEIARGARARHYHLYAVAPLVLTAEIGRANGTDLYAYRAQVLRRVADFTLSALDHPSAIERLAGVVQEPNFAGAGGRAGQYLAWTSFYARRYPRACAAIATTLPAGPLINPELGGDLAMLAGRPCTGRHIGGQ